MRWPRAVRRLLRSPRVIVAEMAAVVVLAAVGAMVPQTGAAGPGVGPDPEGSLTMASLSLLGLDHVFHSPLFLVVTLLTTASLALVVGDQLGRLRRVWTMPLNEAHFRAAPFRVQFQRPQRAEGGKYLRRVRIDTTGKLGLVGSPLLHLGILLVIVAAVVRALFGVESVVDLIEGEPLPPTAAAWSAQWPGPLASPFQVEAPLMLDTVQVSRYPSGELRHLAARVSVGGERRESRWIGVNQALRLPQGRLLVGTRHGAAALVEWWLPDGAAPVRDAVLLEDVGGGVLGGVLSGPGGLTADVRTNPGVDDARPDRLELRFRNDQGEERRGWVAPGEAVMLPGRVALQLHGLRYWVRLRGSRDPGLVLFYLGLAVTIAGAVLIFLVVRVDTCVVLSSNGDSENVLVALRAQRLAPLFEERFRRLVRAHGGSA